MLTHSNATGQVRTVDGGLAGSSVPLSACVRWWWQSTGVSFDDTVRAASWRPAAMLGRTRLLDVGCPVNLGCWNDDGTISKVLFA